MKPIRESIGREIRWRRTRFLPAAYELRTEDEVLASLEWAGLFSGSASAETADGSWLFRRPARLSWSRVIEDTATGTALGRYTPGLIGGVLELGDGSRFRIGRDRLFGRLKVWRKDGGLVLAFSRMPVPGGARLEIEPASSADPRLSLLATFAFYVLTIRRRRAARSGGG